MADAPAGRRTFGPVVLLGLAGGALAAVGGHKTMLAVSASYLEIVKQSSAVLGDEGVDFPLAGALALVTLAGWGAVLVTRGTFRRVVVGATALAAAGVVAVVLVGLVQQSSAESDYASQLGMQQAIPLDPSGWLWATLAGGVLTLVAAVAGLRFAPSWPEMGAKYDGPAAAGAEAASSTPVEEQSNLDIWKSLDEGSDPTA